MYILRLLACYIFEHPIPYKYLVLCIHPYLKLSTAMVSNSLFPCHASPLISHISRRINSITFIGVTKQTVWEKSIEIMDITPGHEIKFARRESTRIRQSFRWSRTRERVRCGHTPPISDWNGCRQHKTCESIRHSRIGRSASSRFGQRGSHAVQSIPQSKISFTLLESFHHSS